MSDSHETTAAPPGSTARILALVALVVVMALAAFLRVTATRFHSYFDDDEADYAMAMSHGATANYLGTKERPGYAVFLDTYREYRETGSAHPWKRDMAAGDVAAFRHMHPPLGLLPAGVLMSHGVRAEGVLRGWPLILGMFACIPVFAAVWLGTPIRGTRLGLVAGVCAAWFLALSQDHAVVSAHFGFHAAFSLLLSLTLLCTMWVLRSVTRRLCFALGALFGATMLTIEYWVLLVPIVAGALLFAVPRAEGRAQTRLARLAWGVLGVFSALVVLWPPFLLRGDFIKPAMLFGWLLVKPVKHGSVNFAWYGDFMWHHLALFVVLVSALVLLVAYRRRSIFTRDSAPFVVYAILFAILNLRVLHMKDLYAGQVVPALAVLGACWLAAATVRWPRRRLATVWGIVLICLAMQSVRAVQHSIEKYHAPRVWQSTIATLQERYRCKAVFVSPRSAAAIFRYYLPTTDRIEPDSVEESDHEAIQQAVLTARYDALFYVRSAARSEKDPPATIPKYSIPKEYSPLSPFPLDKQVVYVWELAAGADTKSTKGVVSK